MISVYSAFFLFVSGNAFSRYWLPVIPFLLLMAYRGLDRSWFLAAAGVMIAVGGISVGGSMLATQPCQAPLMDALEYTRNETDGAVASDSWAITGYLLDRPVYAPWTDYTTLRNRYGVHHAVTGEQLPYRQRATFSNSCQTYHVYAIPHPQ
jgi:hypothetical protein